MTDPLGAFVPGVDVRLAGRAGGPLDGLTFAAKDLFDVRASSRAAAIRIGRRPIRPPNARPPLSRPCWTPARRSSARRSPTRSRSAFSGSTGIYGTPLNPRAPDRVPGGSSSGSASAVAGGACDVALGTDSGGSVRVPASFCGLFGLRPTLGRIDARGMMVQSPTFDTVGYFARDAETFAKVGAVLLGEPIVPKTPAEIVVATDAFAIADEVVRDALAPVVDRCRQVAHVTETSLAMAATSSTGRVGNASCRGTSSARRFASGLTGVNPRFSAEVAGAFADDGRIIRRDDHLRRSFPRRGESAPRRASGWAKMLCIPTSPILPIARDARLSAMREAVHRIVDLTGIAGLTGLPQVNIPAGSAGGIPVGLSLIGWRGGDAALVGAACALAEAVALPELG